MTLDARINFNEMRLLPHERIWVKGERAKKGVLEAAKAQKLVRGIPAFQTVMCIDDPT